jgi:hypothetical protein
MHLPDLDPLLSALDKITAGRVLPVVQVDEDGSNRLIRIPVRSIAPGDRKDVHLRRYIVRWLRDSVTEKRLQIETSFLNLRPGEQAWHTDSGEIIPLLGILEVRISADRKGEMDRWEDEKEHRRKAALKEFYDTVKDGGSTS